MAQEAHSPLGQPVWHQSHAPFLSESAAPAVGQGRAGEEDQQPRKRQKLPRASAACQRCRQRKQRCDRLDNAEACRNCQIFGSECIAGPSVVAGPSGGPPPPSPQHRRSYLPDPGSHSLSLSKSSTSPSQTGPPQLSHPTNAIAGHGHSHEGEYARSQALYAPPDASVDETPDVAYGDFFRLHTEEREVQQGEEGETNSPQDAARGVAFLSVSANGNPVYVGPSSGFSWAKLVLGGVSPAITDDGRRRESTLVVPGSRLLQPSYAALPDEVLAGLGDEVANVVLSRVYRHIQSRYGFLDWLWIHEIWRNRVDVAKRACGVRPTRSDSTSAFFMWMIFALGSRYCHKTPVLRLASPELYYTRAMAHLDVIVGLHDHKNVQALLLMVMYSFRSAEAPNVWFLMGIAVRLCISLGLHRSVQTTGSALSAYNEQMRRRIFWSCYSLERMLAITTGRPPSIADMDIDIPLPLNVDCVEINLDLSSNPSGTTSMTSAILYAKLTQIDSELQQHVYRVDQRADTSTEYIDSLLKRLDAWENSIPKEASERKCWSIPCCSRDWLLIRSAEARMYLLRPCTVNNAGHNRYVRLLAKTAADACELLKRYHQDPASVPSLESLRSVFLAGLTLLHAVSLDTTALPSSTIQRSVRSASNLLFSYAQQLDSVGHFHDAFEELASATLDRLEQAPLLPPSQGNPAPPLALNNTAIDWQHLLQDLPSVPFQDSTSSLLESFGIFSTPYGQDSNLGFAFDNEQPFSSFDTDSFLASVNAQYDSFNAF